MKFVDNRLESNLRSPIDSKNKTKTDKRKTMQRGLQIKKY